MTVAGNKHNRSETKGITGAKPFLKWAGGKSQLLRELENRLPEQIKRTKKIRRYVEPFVGGGAMFFHLQKNYDVKQSYLFDINRELIICYKTIQQNPFGLIEILKALESKYLRKSDSSRKKFYYSVRADFNEKMKIFDYQKYNNDWIKRTANLIFLNRTCYNGLFRQNRKGEFNVPFGRYKKPRICDEDNLIEVQKTLRNVIVKCGDFIDSRKHITKGSFVYLDPPYRPLNITSSFTSYAKDDFDDNDQRRLADFYKRMHSKRSFLMLSNSDPRNEDANDDFFDVLYKDFNINRVLANRMISCNAHKRGRISELVITNY